MSDDVAGGKIHTLAKYFSGDLKMEGIELTDADIAQLKDLFLGVEDDDREDEDYDEETL